MARFMVRLATPLAVLVMVACGSPTHPTAPTGPLHLALAGQSNAGFLKPFLAERASVVGYALVTTITPCWDDVPVVDNEYAGQCWQHLAPTLSPELDAFVWWQGEVDDVGSGYGAKLADLVRRVRARASNPRLLVVVVQLGPAAGDDPASPVQEGRRWTEQDAHALYVETRDFEYQADRTHMTEQGYRDVSDRIVATVHATLGR